MAYSIGYAIGVLFGLAAVFSFYAFAAFTGIWLYNKLRKGDK